MNWKLFAEIGAALLVALIALGVLYQNRRNKATAPIVPQPAKPKRVWRGMRLALPRWLPAVLWIWTITVGAIWVMKQYVAPRYSWHMVVLATLATTLLVMYNWVMVDGNKAMSIKFLGKRIRSVGPGLHPIFRGVPFLPAIESVDYEVSLDLVISIVKVTIELAGGEGEVLDLEMAVHWKPKPAKLLNLLAFGFLEDKQKLEDAIKATIDEFASDLYGDLPDDAAVYKDLKKVAERIRRRFYNDDPDDLANGEDFRVGKETLSDYYGIEVVKVGAKDPILPDSVKKAREGISVQKAENQKLELLVAKQTEAAKTMVKASGRKDPMSFKEALRYLKTDKVDDKREVKTFSISVDAPLLGVAKDFLSGTLKRGAPEAPVARKETSGPVDPKTIGYDTPRPGFNQPKKKGE